ncbi:MAG TPA: response regulator [Bryobacteraceae bacterium]|jgi:two-component system response regulator RegA
MLEPTEASLVMIVDDDEVFRNRLCRAFAQRSWVAHGASTGNETVALTKEIGPDLVVVDLRLAGENGLDIVKRLREVDSMVKIIMLTGYGSIANAMNAIKLGADHYISKPADVDQILAIYENLIQGEDIQPAEEPASVPSLARVEWEHIQRVLTDCGGNISQTAKMLGLHRRSLQRKLDKYPPRQ